MLGSVLRDLYADITHSVNLQYDPIDSIWDLDPGNLGSSQLSLAINSLESLEQVIISYSQFPTAEMGIKQIYIIGL